MNGPKCCDWARKDRAMMEKYPKIRTLFKRDMSRKGCLLFGQWACPEFEYLRNNLWDFTEKVDGTNVRVHWQAGCGVKYGGRTDDAQMPVFLYDRLTEVLPAEIFEKNIDKTTELTLYGEGFGARIQKGGGNYNPNGVDFVLFDVLVDGWWLQRADVCEVASSLGVEVVPNIGSGTLSEAAS